MKYIDAGTTAEKISNEFEIPMSELCDVFADIPSADVQPVKHGRWIHIRGCWWQCSNCENNLIYTMSDRGRTEKHRYCSKCGARMDGGSEYKPKDGDTE